MNSKFSGGVFIISKYIPILEQDGFDIQAAHDQIWFGSYELVDKPEDREELERLGWFEDCDSWSFHT